MVWQQVANLPGEISCESSTLSVTADVWVRGGDLSSAFRFPRVRLILRGQQAHKLTVYVTRERARLDEGLVLKTSSGNHPVVGSSPTLSSLDPHAAAARMLLYVFRAAWGSGNRGRANC